MAQTVTAIKKAKHIATMYKGLGYDLQRTIDMVAWYTMTDREQLLVEKLYALIG